MIANIKLRLKSNHKKPAMRKFNVKKLSSPKVAENYRTAVSGRLSGLSVDRDIENCWIQIKQAFNETSKEILGFAERRRAKEWISEETYKLVDERRALKPRSVDNPAEKKHYIFFAGRSSAVAREIRRPLFVNGLCKEVHRTGTDSKKTGKFMKASRKSKGTVTSHKRQERKDSNGFGRDKRSMDLALPRAV